MAWSPPPVENFEGLIDQLVSKYQLTAKQIDVLLGKVDINTLTPKERRQLLKALEEILSSADANAGKWVDKVISQAYVSGAATALVSLGIVMSLIEGKKMVNEDSKLNKVTIDSIKQVTYDDLLLMTQNTRKQVKQILSKILAETMKGKEIGIHNTDLTKQYLQQLKKAGNLAIVDRAGKTWTLEAYAKMVVRTKISQAQRAGIVNEALKRGALLGVISANGSQHASCRKWENKIVKLTPDAPGDYPLLSDLENGDEIFHPHCKHQVFPVRSVDLLPKSILDQN